MKLLSGGDTDPAPQPAADGGDACAEQTWQKTGDSKSGPLVPASDIPQAGVQAQVGLGFGVALNPDHLPLVLGHHIHGCGGEGA